MNLLADESVDRLIVERLRQDGHVVYYIAEMEPGIPDDSVLQQAHERNALLITADKDFGELIFRLNRLSEGVVLLRLAGLSSAAKADLTASVFQLHGSELVSAFTVLSASAVRIRPRST